eukprot:gene18140-5740_t
MEPIETYHPHHGNGAFGNHWSQPYQYPQTMNSQFHADVQQPSQLSSSRAPRQENISPSLRPHAAPLSAKPRGRIFVGNPTDMPGHRGWTPAEVPPSLGPHHPATLASAQRQTPLPPHVSFTPQVTTLSTNASSPTLAGIPMSCTSSPEYSTSEVHNASSLYFPQQPVGNT